MAGRDEIIKVLTNKDRFMYSSILIDEFGYSIHEILDVNENTKDTDTVIVAYSVGYNHWENVIVADTHFITLNDLLGADTVMFGMDNIVKTIH